MSSAAVGEARAVINAGNAYVGGGATLACNFLNWMARQNVDAHVIIPDLPMFRSLPWSRGFRPQYVRAGSLRGLRRAYFDEFELPRLCRDTRAELLFTMGNIGPARVACPHVVLLQNPYYAYGKCEARRRLPWRSRARMRLEEMQFARCVRSASALLVQTPVMAARVQERYRVSAAKIKIVGNAVDTRLLALAPKTPSPVYRLLYLSRYYTHKNFEILGEVAAELQRRRPGAYRFITAVGPADGLRARRWLRRLQALGVAELFDNKGYVPYDQLSPVYTDADAALCPTLLESCSATYIEAMHFALPIITSDLDFAHEACQDAAVYCNPLRAGEFADAIEFMRANPASAADLVERGRRLLDRRPLQWHQVAPALAAAAGILPLARYVSRP